MMRAVSLWGSLALVAISTVAAAVFLVVPRIPIEQYRPEINQKISQALGRPVRIDGALRLRLVPQLTVSIEDVKIDNIASGSQPLMARMKALNLRASFFPLLQGKIEVDAIVLDEPTILLEIARSGQANWAFEPQTRPGPESQVSDSLPSASATPSDGGAPGAPAASLDEQLTRLDIKDFRISNGRITYLDQRSGYRQSLTIAKLNGSLEGAEQRVSLAGRLGWQGLDLDYQLSLAPITAALDGGTLNLSATINAASALSGKLDGRLQLTPNLGYEGRVELASERLPDILEMAGLNLPQARQLRGPLSAKGDLVFVDNSFAFTNASFSADLPAVAASFDGRLGYQAAAPNVIGSFQVQLKDTAALLKVASEQSPTLALPPLSGTAEASGDLLLVGQDFDLGQAQIQADLNWGQLRYDGQITKRASSFASDGQANLALPDLAPLADWARTQRPEVPQLSGSAKAAGRLALAGTDFSLLGASLEARTNLGELLFNGDLQSIGEQRFAQGSYSAQAQDLKGILALVPPSLLASMPGLRSLSGSLQASGRLQAQDQRIESQDTQFLAQTSLGQLALGGSLWLDADQGQALDQQLGLDLQARGELPALEQVLAIAAPSLQTGLSEDSRLTFDGRLQHQAGQSQISAATLALSNAEVSASFSGDANLQGSDITAQGQIAAQGRSLRALTQRYGLDLPGKPEVYGPFSLQGSLDHRQSQTRFEQATLNLDGNALRMAAMLDLGQPKPYVQANLVAPRLALDPYLSAEDHQPVASAQNASLSNNGGNGWDTAPIDWSGLQAFNGDFSLKSQGLSLYGFALDQAEITASLRDGRLQADLPSLQAYDGSGTGTLVLNARGAEPSLAVKAKVNQVNVKPLFQALAGREELSGTGDLEVDLLTFGINQSRLMSNLKGSSTINLRDGSLLGLDLPATIATLKSRQLDPALGRTRVTKFQDLGAQALIEQGVLRTEGFQLTSDKVALTGKGQVDLGKRQINYRIEPRLTAGYVQTEGLNPGISKLTLPLQIFGPWNDLRIQMDLTGFLTLARDNPEALLDLIPRDLAKDILPDDINLDALASERRRQAQQVLEQQAAQAQALRQQAEQAAAEQAAALAEQAQRLQAEAEARALEQAERLRQAQQSLEDSAGQAVDNLLNNLFQ